MCGRYSFVPSEFQLKEDLAGMEMPDDLQTSYNLAPTQKAYVISNEEPGQLQVMQWGLVPFWSKDGTGGGRMINARKEGLAEKPAFRNSFKRRRCIVPADSFYEWRNEGGKQKVPYRIFRPDGHLLFFAGLWDEWQNDKETKRTFTIITTPPNTEVAYLHDRMPKILYTAEDRRRWLDALDPIEAEAMLTVSPDNSLSYYRVSTDVNSPANNNASLHQPDEESAST